MPEFRYKQIGVIHSPFKEPRGTPIQPTAGKDIEGTAEVFPEFREGLKDLDGFSHIILIFHCHLTKASSLSVKPFLDDQTRGVFSTRAPGRPNPIGISVVRLIGIEENLLHIKDLDIIDGTPLLDIKPFVSEFDERKAAKKGWLEKNLNKLHESKDDGRFIN
jgi:tRNA-Thr(GGU) m(6)t(6)A37 methyltransferase TsaA